MICLNTCSPNKQTAIYSGDYFISFCVFSYMQRVGLFVHWLLTGWEWLTGISFICVLLVWLLLCTLHTCVRPYESCNQRQKVVGSMECIGTYSSHHIYHLHQIKSSKSVHWVSDRTWPYFCLSRRNNNHNNKVANPFIDEQRFTMSVCYIASAKRQSNRTREQSSCIHRI